MENQFNKNQESGYERFKRSIGFINKLSMSS
jgi:hypothetical protein